MDGVSRRLALTLAATCSNCQRMKPKLRPFPPGVPGARWIRLGQDRGFTLVDPDVYEWAIKQSWSLMNGYAVGRKDKRTLGMHRIVMGLGRCRYSTSRVVDHINHDRLDNRRCNLRVCYSAANNQNRRQTGRCAAAKNNGKPCESFPIPYSDKCWAHTDTGIENGLKATKWHYEQRMKNAE